MSPAEEASSGGERQGVERGSAVSHSPGFLTIPNLLSLSRVPLGIGFLIVNDPLWLALIVAVGAFTDLLDGFVARRSGTVSEVGNLLDPLCDKFFILVGLLSFLPSGHLDWAGFLVLILRDIFTTGTYLLALLSGRIIPYRSRPGGKVTTALQVGTLFAILFWPEYVPVFVLFVGAVSVYAIIDYGMMGLKAEERKART